MNGRPLFLSLPFLPVPKRHFRKEPLSAKCRFEKWIESDSDTQRNVILPFSDLFPDAAEKYDSKFLKTLKDVSRKIQLGSSCKKWQKYEVMSFMYMGRATANKFRRNHLSFNGCFGPWGDKIRPLDKTPHVPATFILVQGRKARRGGAQR